MYRIHAENTDTGELFSFYVFGKDKYEAHENAVAFIKKIRAYYESRIKNIEEL